MCYEDGSQPPLPPIAGGAADNADVTLTSADGNRFAGFLARPFAPLGAQTLILPDVRGLHQFYKELAVRFAEQGVTALALDYFGRTAGIGPRDDSFEYMPHVARLDFRTISADVDAGLAYLRASRADAAPTFTVGFCMGGSLSLLTGTRDLGLNGVIGFYAGMTRSFVGAGTLLDQAMRSKYPVLALFGGADQGIPPEHVERLKRELDEASVEHEVVVYPGAPHSFFDRRFAEYAAASADAWKRVLEFIKARSGALNG
ncbi:MAG: dienelactone hydrolase family protein [Chloroflexota bacterium]